MTLEPVGQMEGDTPSRGIGVHHILTASLIFQGSCARDVICMSMGINAMGQCQLLLIKSLQVFLNMFQNRIDEDRLFTLFVCYEVGSAWTWIQLGFLHFPADIIPFVVS